MEGLKRHFVTIRDSRWGARQVHYRRAGSGPTVVLLHRLPRCSLALLPVLMRLKSRFTCIAPDAPGHGLSDSLGADSLDAADAALAILEFFDAVGIRKAALYGEHDGAMLAVAFALAFPDRVACVVANGYALPSEPEQEGLLANYHPVPEPVWDGSHLTALWSRARDHASFFPWYVHDAAHRLDIEPPSPQHMHETVLGWLRAGNDCQLLGRAAFSMRSAEALQQVTVPLLLTASSSDAFASHLSRVSDAAPSVTVRQGGTPEETLDLAAAFLARHAPEPAPASTTVTPVSTRLWNDFVDVPGGQLRVRRNDNASGRVVVLQHDAAGSSETLDPLAKSFIGRRPVLAIDLPGHGGSDPPQPTVRVTVQAYARAVVEALDALGIGDFDFVGVGGGGFIGLELARSHTRRVRHIVLAEPLYFPMTMQAELREQYAPRIEPDWYGGHLLLAWHLVRDQQLFWPWYHRKREGIVRQPSDLDAAILHERVVALLGALQAWRATCQAMFSYSVQARLSRLEVPALLCAPPLDPRLDHSQAALRDHPHLAFRRMPDDRTQWAAELLPFLDR